MFKVNNWNCGASCEIYIKSTIKTYWWRVSSFGCHNLDLMCCFEHVSLFFFFSFPFFFIFKNFLVLLVFFTCQFSFFHFSFLIFFLFLHFLCFSYVFHLQNVPPNVASYEYSSNKLTEWQGKFYCDHQILLYWRFSRKHCLWCKRSLTEILVSPEGSLRITAKRCLTIICLT